MINFLHTFNPEPLMLSWGFLSIHWYGFFVFIAILIGIASALYLSHLYSINKEDVIDLAFYLLIFGLLGARLYDVFLEYEYYLHYPIEAFKIWNGGLAIHGGVIAGFLVLLYFIAKKKIRGVENLSFWSAFLKLAAIIAPSLAIGQSIGRWGNYFNQELFGLPTSLPWGIPIDVLNRPGAFTSYQYFHPTFLYESIALFLLFIFLFSYHLYIIKRKDYSWKSFLNITVAYLFFASLLRFLLEFVKIDKTLLVFGLRFPQIMTISLIIFSIVFYVYIYKKLNK